MLKWLNGFANGFILCTAVSAIGLVVFYAVDHNDELKTRRKNRKVNYSKYFEELMKEKEEEKE